MIEPLERSRPLLCFVHDAARGEIPGRLVDVLDPVWALVDLVQVRGKTLPSGELEGLTHAWRARLAGVGPAIVVNDRIDVALACGADGVHLGRDDLPLGVARALAPPGFLIGASAHDRDELWEAQDQGADYAGLGAFFATATKPGAAPFDAARAGLAGPVPGLTLPVLAIGGITAAGIASALRVPAVTGVAVSGSVQHAANPAAAIQELRSALDECWTRERGLHETAR